MNYLDNSMRTLKREILFKRGVISSGIVATIRFCRRGRFNGRIARKSLSGTVDTNGTDRSRRKGSRQSR